MSNVPLGGGRSTGQETCRRWTFCSHKISFSHLKLLLVMCVEKKDKRENLLQLSKVQLNHWNTCVFNFLKTDKQLIFISLIWPPLIFNSHKAIVSPSAPLIILKCLHWGFSLHINNFIKRLLKHCHQTDEEHIPQTDICYFPFLCLTKLHTPTQNKLIHMAEQRHLNQNKSHSTWRGRDPSEARDTINLTNTTRHGCDIKKKKHVPTHNHQ